MSLSEAFNLVLTMNKRPVTISRPGGSSISSFIVPSNYFRHLQAPSEITIEGREFIISKKDLGVFIPKKGDRITDSEIGTMAISEAREIFGLGTEILGYRVRIS